MPRLMQTAKKRPRSASEADQDNERDVKRSSPNATSHTPQPPVKLEQSTRNLTQRQLQTVILDLAESDPSIKKSIEKLVSPVFKYANHFSSDLRKVKETCGYYGQNDHQLVIDTVERIVTKLHAGLKRLQKGSDTDQWLLWRRTFDVLLQIGFMADGTWDLAARAKFLELGFFEKLGEKLIEVLECLGETASIVDDSEFKVLQDQLIRLDLLLFRGGNRSTRITDLIYEMDIALDGYVAESGIEEDYEGDTDEENSASEDQEAQADQEGDEE